MATTAIDESRLEAFMGQVLTDMGAIISAPLMALGERLGLYKAMAHAGALSSQEVAERGGSGGATGAGMASQPGGRRLCQLRRRHRHVHAAARSMRSRSPTRRVRSTFSAYLRLRRLPVRDRRARSRKRSAPANGMGWHEHDAPALPWHRAFLPARLPGPPRLRWIPLSTACTEKLERGARWPTSAAATAPPRSSWRKRFRTLSSSASTTTRRRSRGARAGRRGTGLQTTGSRSTSPRKRVPRQRRTTSSASSTASTTWATRSGRHAHIRQALADDGTWMIVEPFAKDRVEREPQPGRPCLLRSLDA